MPIDSVILNWLFQLSIAQSPDHSSSYISWFLLSPITTWLYAYRIPFLFRFITQETHQLRFGHLLPLRDAFSDVIYVIKQTTMIKNMTETRQGASMGWLEETTATGTRSPIVLLATNPRRLWQTINQQPALVIVHPTAFLHGQRQDVKWACDNSFQS